MIGPSGATAVPVAPEGLPAADASTQSADAYQHRIRMLISLHLRPDLAYDALLIDKESGTHNSHLLLTIHVLQQCRY